MPAVADPRLKNVLKARKAIRKPYRIFVNRNLALDGISMIGFDMDYTLAIYRRELLEHLAFQETIQKLVTRGYPEEILELRYDPTAVVRGLVIDKRHGNLLKMNRFGQVVRAVHGLRLLSEDELNRSYANRRIRINDQRYHSVDTLFDLPSAHLYAELVQFMSLEERRGAEVDYTKLFGDTLACLDESHRDNSIKRHIIADPAKFLAKDRLLPPVLDRIRQAGKKVFLLTNSEWYYTECLMEYLFSGEMKEYPNWKDYFDRIIVESRKPDFFCNANPFLSLDGQVLAPGDVGKHKILRHGNSRLFQKMEETWGDRILFVGDHIYGDILRSKQSHGWRTAMIIEELENELESSFRARTLRGRLNELRLEANLLDYERSRAQRQLDALRDYVDGNAKKRGFFKTWTEERILKEIEAQSRRLQRCDQKIRQNLHEVQVLQHAFDATYNPSWGPLLKDRNDTSRFGQQIKQYACLYTSKVSNFISYPMEKHFYSPVDLMPHDLS